MNQDVVIVAEDSLPNRKILQNLLEKFHFHVEVCDNGLQAWTLIEKLRGRKELVAVITDILMPELDGIELLKKIRADSEYAKLPVIIVTALSDKSCILEARNHHVDGYILKPITLQKLESKLKELFPHHVFPLLVA
jgi:two-component system chemotaxis response regulator CheY